MNSLEYTIFGNKKKIIIDSINSDENLIKKSDSNYEYIITEKAENTFEKLLNLLDIWNNFSKKNNITYWATAGTLLGAIRHNGFIPWDNDIDICVYLSDLTKLKEKLNEDKILKYKESYFGLRIFIDNMFPFLDIFVCDYYCDNIIKYSGYILHNKSTWFINDLFPKEYFFKEELIYLHEVPFENGTIIVPKKSNDILYRMFSKNCLTSCIISPHTIFHEFNSDISNVGEELFKYMYIVEKQFNIPNENTVTFKTLKTLLDLSSNKNLSDFLKIFNK